ncbi:MAG: site-specific DNA-methyltransferase [Clostridiaceae bacterium]
MARKKSVNIDTTGMHDIEAYTHDDKKRTNNPPVGMAQHDTAPETRKTYAFDPHIDPTLDWAGKTEGVSFDVPTSSIHIHESFKPHKIIRSVQTIGDDYQDGQLSFFETPVERMRRRRDAIEFYQHGVDWTNRLIAGDSLVIMNSLLEKEGLAGQVQMVYIDPPYGIKYGSNFQPFVDKRDVKDKKDEDLTQEPEMIKAFRDTWELGIHSYLTYLRNRLLLARELLADSGSVFVQISDENVHLVRNLCDEVFGATNFISQITFQKTGSLASNLLGSTVDYIIWYGKDKKKVEGKYRQLYLERNVGDTSLDRYDYIELTNGKIQRLTRPQILGTEKMPNGKRMRYTTLLSDGETSSSDQSVEFEGEIFLPRHGKHWKTSVEGIGRLISKNRIQKLGSTIWYKRYVDDFPVLPMNERWESLQIGVELSYVVQTSPLVIQRCMLMTTDPGDLVLDITCGSGTTAYVAEQWGRRWITCDTSRVAITLAKKRLMTATYDYYKLAHEEQGVSGGFVYKTVPHITLKSIANNEPPATETLYDQPEMDKSKIRISGPFTVEALPAPVVKPLDDTYEMPEDYTAKQTDWREELLATGILGRGGNKIEFSRVEPLSGTAYLQAEAETKEDIPRRAVICFADETKPMDSRMVALALTETEDLRPTPKLIVFAAFQFDPEAAKDIDSTKWAGVTCLKVQMNTDLMTEDLKKKRSSNQSFWLVGQPDVELIHIEKGKDKGKYQVRVNGFDYYDVKKGTVESGNAGRIAMWMLDTNYDGMSIEPMQVFFPLGGKDEGWAKLSKTLKAEINQDLIEQYAGTESLPFTIDGSGMIAVKIIDDRGIESLKVLKIGG